MPRYFSAAAVPFLVLAAAFSSIFAQDAGVHPPPFRGVNTQVGGVFVTPVAGAPFSAVVKIESTQVLPDGTSAVRKTIAAIARDSQGRIYNEHRQLLPASFTGTPGILSMHLFDPQTRISTFLDPRTRLARQQTLPERAISAGASVQGAPVASPSVKQEDLGTEMMENLAVNGVRQSRTIPAAVSSTGKDILVTDEYWYSDELHMNIVTKHNDPRTGVQLVTVTQINRNEPEATIFEVPSGYKIVDENPPN